MFNGVSLLANRQEYAAWDRNKGQSLHYERV